MEKIKDALAKAKLKKKTSTKDTNSSVMVKTSKSVQTSRNKDIGNLSYSNSVVVTLNSAHLEENRIVSHLPHGSATSLFSSLRTKVLQKMEEHNWQTVAIVSPTQESGKTVVSINLAISIANQPQKTAMLVDFDLRKPKVAQYLGIQAKYSLNEYLEGTAELASVIINPSIQHLTVLPTMQPVERPSEILSSNRVKSLIKELKDRYDSRIVLIDLPPALNADDAMLLFPEVDCVLLVIANGVSTELEIEDTLHLIPKDKLLGVVYNKAEEEQKSYYY